MKKVLIILVLTKLLFPNSFCVVIDGEAVVTSGHSTNETVSLPQKFGYGFIAGDYKDNLVEMYEWKFNKKNYERGNTIGWIDKKYITCGDDRADKDTYIETMKIKYQDGDTTKDSILYDKAFVVNSVKKNLNISKVTNIPIYDSAISSQTTKNNSKLYEIYFILKETNDKVLLSKTSTIYSDSYGNNKNQNIVGWIDKKFLKRWSSRVAIEPTDDSLEGYWDSSFSKKAKYKAKIDKPKNNYSLRYPQLEILDKGIKISYMQKEGVFGKERNIISNVLQNPNPHIVFLVDATAGMQSYLDNVKGAINAYLSDNAANSDNISVAVAVYRDYSDGKDKYRLITGGFVTPERAKKMINSSYFRAKSTNDSVGNVYNGKKVDLDRSRSEALFNGIVSLYRDRKLQLDSYENPTRLILIGDHGNHVYDDKGYTAQSVSEVLGKKVVIDAIQVHTDPVNSTYVKRFESNMKDLIRLRDGGASGSFVVDDAGTVQTIKSNIEKAARISRKVKTIIKKVYTKGVELTLEEKKFLETQLDIDVDNLGEVQQSLELYIHNNQRKKYKKVILARAELINDLSSAYNRMASSIAKYKSDKAGVRKLVMGLKTAIETLTGQEISNDENIAEFMSERLKIPKSKILNLTFEDWQDKLGRNENNYRKKIIQTFRRNATLLSALYAQKEYINIKFDKNNEVDYDEKKDANGNVITVKTKFDISVMHGNEYDQSNGFKNKWIWVPFEYMP
jgi:hypothetical protein